MNLLELYQDGLEDALWTIIMRITMMNKNLKSSGMVLWVSWENFKSILDNKWKMAKNGCKVISKFMMEFKTMSNMILMEDNFFKNSLMKITD